MYSLMFSLKKKNKNLKNKTSLSADMEGIIANFRRGRHRQKDRQMIIKVEGITSKEKANELTGKKIVWKSPSGKEIKGRISSAHGNKGAMRVIFEKGMPGQAIGSKVNIED